MGVGVSAKLSPLIRFFRLMQLDKKEIYYIYIYSILSGLITLVLPLGIQAIIGLIAGGGLSASLFVLIAVVTIASSMTGIFRVLQLVMTETIQRRIFARAAIDFSYRLPRFEMKNIHLHYPPELVNRFFDTITLQKGVPKLLIDFTTAVLQIFFGLLLISFYHPFFVFLSILMVFVFIIIFRFTGKKGLDTSIKESHWKYNVAHWLEEVARTMGSFKLNGNPQFSLMKTDNLVLEYLENRNAHFKVLKSQYIIIVVFKTIFTATLLLLGSILVINNQINIGQFVAAEIIVILVLASVEKLILSMDTIYDVLTAVDKLGTVTDIPLENENGIDAKEVGFDQSGINLEIRDLSYQYPDAEIPALKNISFNLESGEKVCVAGYNGSGKSTFLKILSGLYLDFSGNIFYNGVPQHSIKISSLRQKIGDYTSDEDIFEGTIFENITMGREGVSQAEVMETIKICKLDEFIKNQKEGILSFLLPNGRNIPGSVRAKILLARAIVCKPKLLVLAGFFGGIQRKEENEIIRMITANEQKWSLIAVSDNPFFAESCDRVIILKDGKIVENDKFEVLKTTPHFKKVFRSIETES
jgi:ABC-type bacteriocin/lantibiotic exporter with double-glycine peptidase domain